MDINSIFQIATVGILVAVINQVLTSAGRQDQATMTTIAGVIIVLFWVIHFISDLFDTIQSLFSF